MKKLDMLQYMIMVNFTIKLEISKVASKIVEEELMESGFYTKVWQAYAAVGDDKAVGVVGDERKYGNIVMIRVVD